MDKVRQTRSWTLTSRTCQSQILDRMSFGKVETVFLLNSPPPSRRYLTKGPPGVPTPASEAVNTEQVQDTEVTEDTSRKSRKRHTEELRCSLNEDVIGKKLAAELLSCTAWNSIVTLG